MTTKPTRATVAGRAYLDLQAKARKEKRPTDELLRLYALECFLDRLSASNRASDLVLKGGVLLAAYELRRPTRDVDFLAQHVDNDIDAVLSLVKAIMRETKDDGCVYGEPTAEIIREDAAYSGVRVKIPCSLAGAQVSFSVDVNVGDPVSPPPVKVVIARLLGGEVSVRGYPLPMVLAEKLVTAIERGPTNTRWRDFADVYLISSRHSVRADDLKQSIAKVASHRRVTMTTLTSALPDFAMAAQTKWSAWVRNERLDDRLPLVFSDVLAAVQAFADPLITDELPSHAWDPVAKRWVSSRS